MLHKPEGPSETGADDHYPDDDGPPPMRPELQAKFDALPPSVLKATPFAKRIGPDDNFRIRVDVCMLALRHNGFTLEEVIEASRSFSNGCGLNALGKHTPALIAELWREQDKLEADREGAAANAPSVIDGNWWLTRELPPPMAVLGQVICASTRMLLGGPTGVGKTHFAMAMAGALSVGRGYLHWLGPSSLDFS